MDDRTARLMVDEAAEAGALRALERLGLHDPQAAHDLRELRGVLDAWRDVKRTAGQTFVRLITTAFLGVMAGGLAMMFWRHR